MKHPDYGLDRLTIRSTLLVGSLYALIAALDGVALWGHIVRPSAVVPVVAGLLLGPAGAWGAVTGAVLTHLIRGAFGPSTVFTALAVGLLGYLPYRLWAGFGRLSSGEAPRVRSVRAVVEFWTVTLVASSAAAATLGWGYELLGLFPFYVGVKIFAEILFVPLVLGPPLLYLLQPAVVELDRRSSGPSRRVPVYRRRPFPRRVALVPPLWLFAGALGSAGYRTFEILAVHGSAHLRVRGLGFLLTLDDEVVFGAGGAHVVIAFGAFMFFVLATSLVFAGNQYVYSADANIHETETT